MRVALGCLAALAGCAVIPPGDVPALVLGYTASDPAGGSWRRVVPGVELDLTADTAGLRLGWSDLTVATGAAGPATEAGPGLSWAFPLGVRWLGDDGLVRTLGLALVERRSPAADQPLFVAHGLAGVSLEAGRVRAGLQLGLVRQTHLSCPPLHGAWLLVHAEGRTRILPMAPEDFDVR